MNLEKKRRTQGCLTDAVAFLLDRHPENVPFFVYPRKGWNERLKKFFKKNGYVVWWADCDKPPKRGTHLVCGDSLKYKTFAHAVIYRNGKLIYDPQYPSKWKDNRITHKLVLKKLTL